MVALPAPDAGAANAAPAPNATEVVVTYDDFEANFPGTVWSVADANSGSGTDTWGGSSFRSYAGNGSAWSAGSGNQTWDVTGASEGFETGAANWTFDRDTVATYGYDYWGLSTYRAHNGNSSIWCAQVGTQQSGGAANTAARAYDEYMNASAWMPVNLSGWSSATLDYWFFLDSQQSYDFLWAAYFKGSWILADKRSGRQGGTGWQQSTITVPTDITRIGFFFASNNYQHFEGAYIDDIQLYGTRSGLNKQLHTYDTNQTATMARGVDVSRYDSARLDYQYWLDAEAGVDTLEAGFFSGGNWTYTDLHTGTSGGWVASSLSIPTNTTLIGFRFLSDAVGRLEGAYIDEVRVWGSVLPLLCLATVAETSGMEGVTPFHYSAGAAKGLYPYTWSWQFSDGTTSALQNPSHPYHATGDFTATLTVRDSIGQFCSTQAPAVTVSPDTTNASVSPSSITVIEGESFTAYGADGQGHPYPLDWAYDPPSCGSLDRARGATVLFTASAEAGGLTCALTGSIDSVQASITVRIDHDTRTITLDPASAIVVEGKSIAISAVDAYGHGLDFVWGATCGRVAANPGPSTVFSATTTGGVVCEVTAAIAGHDGTSVLTIVHDTSEIVITPPIAAVFEGANQPFSAVDVYAHPFDADWSVEPASCGVFSSSPSASTTFTASQDTGGSACRITAASLTDAKSFNLTINHDTRTISLTPTSVSDVEGGTQTFAASDAYGHPFSVTWSVSPGVCGDLDPGTGASTTLTLDPDAGGLLCTVSAAVPSGSRLSSLLSALHGPPTSVDIAASATVVDAGASVLLTGQVLDARGHVLAGFSIDWTASCGALGTTTGDSNALSVPKEGAGTTCTVTAAHGSATGTLALQVIHASPYTVTISPPSPSIGAGESVKLTASVIDANGFEVPDAPVAWSSTCGALSSASGATTTFTAPSDGAKCSVTVSTSAGSAGVPGSIIVTVASSPLLLIVGAAAAAGGGIGLLLYLRRRRAGSVPELSAAPAGFAPYTPRRKAADILVETPVTYDIPMYDGPCPACGQIVEAGWAACPACGVEFGAR